MRNSVCELCGKKCLSLHCDSCSGVSNKDFTKDSDSDITF